MKANRYNRFTETRTFTNENMTVQQLFDNCIPKIIKAAKHKGLTSKEDIQDLIQEAFIVFVEKSRNEKIDNPENFLFKIVFNLIKNHFKQKGRNESISSIEESIKKCEKSFSIDPFLLKEIKDADEERLSYLINLMDTHLSAIQNKIVRLRFFNGMSHQEISEETGLSETNVRMKFSRALRELRPLV